MGQSPPCSPPRPSRPATDHPQLSQRAVNTPVGRTETESISKHTKTFPRKKRCDHQTNLFDDLRCCLQMRNFEVVQEPSGGFYCLLPRTVINPEPGWFCSATRL